MSAIRVVSLSIHMTIRRCFFEEGVNQRNVAVIDENDLAPSQVSEQGVLSMNTRQAKQTVQEWVEANIEQWPGIRSAHLVGGITTMSDNALFPSYKDVDLHLIFEEGNPALSPTGPFLNLLETPYRGLLLEAGMKSMKEYESAEAVLSNPEIADHFTVDSVLYGTLDNLLRGLTPQRIKNRVKQAQEAQSVGDWQREIAIWDEITDLIANKSACSRWQFHERLLSVCCRDPSASHQRSH